MLKKKLWVTFGFLLFIGLGVGLFFYSKKMSFSQMANQEEFKNSFVSSCSSEILSQSEVDIEDSDAGFEASVQNVCLCIYDKIKVQNKIEVKFFDKVENLQQSLVSYLTTPEGQKEMEFCITTHMQSE